MKDRYKNEAEWMQDFDELMASKNTGGDAPTSSRPIERKVLTSAPPRPPITRRKP
jgi:hypothetical protein